MKKQMNKDIVSNIVLLWLQQYSCAVPVYDAASAVSPACISLFVLSDTHSVPDEAEPQHKI